MATTSQSVTLFTSFADYGGAFTLDVPCALTLIGRFDFLLHLDDDELLYPEANRNRDGKVLLSHRFAPSRFSMV